MKEEKRMQPIMILQPDSMSDEDMQRLRDNGLCVVVAKEPALVRFMDPIPSVSSRTDIENAAIRLSRKMVTHEYWGNEDGRRDYIAELCDIIIKGSPLDPQPTQQEQETRIFSSAKADELRRLAREEAKAERAAAKEAEATKKKAEAKK